MLNPHVVSSHYNVSNTVVDFTSKCNKPRFLFFAGSFSAICFFCILLNRSVLFTTILCFTCAMVMLFMHRNEVLEESVLVIKDFGVQLRLKYASGLEEIKFLERSKIEDVVIHEFIQGASVHFALAFLVCESNQLVLVFKEVYPGLDFIKRVYLKCIEHETVRR